MKSSSGFIYEVITWYHLKFVNETHLRITGPWRQMSRGKTVLVISSHVSYHTVQIHEKEEEEMNEKNDNANCLKEEPLISADQVFKIKQSMFWQSEKRMCNITLCQQWFKAYFTTISALIFSFLVNFFVFELLCNMKLLIFTIWSTQMHGDLKVQNTFYHAPNNK